MSQEASNQLSRRVFAGAVSHPTARHRSDRVPLTFEQRWPWNLLDPEARTSTRSVALSVDLSGPLDVEGLRRSVAALIRRHESLRTRIVSGQGGSRQEIDEPHDDALDIVDLTNPPGGMGGSATKPLIEELVHQGFPVDAGPLFAARLLRLADERHVLILAADHLISDYASLDILLRDLWMFYQHVLRGTPAALPLLPVQFADYAVWQQKNISSWTRKHGHYWRNRFAGATRVLPFAADGVAMSTPARTAMLSVRLGETSSVRLREWSRRERTTPPLAVLTAYVACLMQWCNCSDLVIGMVCMGRQHPDVRNAVGCFASTLYLRVELREPDRFPDLLQRIAAEYYSAHAHFDSGSVAAQTPTPEFIANPRFNWLPPANTGTSSPTADGPGLEELSGFRQDKRFIAPREDFDPRGGACELVLADSGADIAGSFWYRADLYPTQVARRFTERFLVFVEKMLEGSPTRVMAV